MNWLIESVLAGQAGVANAVVLLREDQPGDDRPVAYVAPDGSSPDPGTLRDALRATLPDYMVPSAFVVEAMPLTSNGKVDRKALPAPDGDADRSQRYIAPHTPTETQLAAVWIEVLGVPRVGVDDNFFELGGHSLPAVQVLTRVRGAFHIDVPLSTLFEHPTLSGFARRIDLVIWTISCGRVRSGDTSIRTARRSFCDSFGSA